MHEDFSACCIFTDCSLVMYPNAVYSSAPVLLVGDCLTSDSWPQLWPLTPSHVWPPLATTCFHWLAPTSNSELVCLRTVCQSQSQSHVTTDSQSASLSWCQDPIWGSRPDFCYCGTVAGLLMWAALSDRRMGLSFTIDAVPHQHSHSRILVPWDSGPYFTVSDLRLPQLRGPGPHIYIPQEQGGHVIPPATWFHFHHLLWHTGLWWRYWNLLPHGLNCLL
jgi:hypothetical protein